MNIQKIGKKGHKKCGKVKLNCCAFLAIHCSMCSYNSINSKPSTVSQKAIILYNTLASDALTIIDAEFFLLHHYILLIQTIR